MKFLTQKRWFWAVLLFVLLVGGTAVALWPRANPISPALDRLAAVDFNERWSHPDMVRIRALGVKAVPDLRRTFTEIESRRTRVLLWLKAKWPGAPKYIPNFPDPQRLLQRRFTACQVLKVLGPAGKGAAPELIKMLKNGDGQNAGTAFVALQEVGVDGEICERLAELVEDGISVYGREHAIYIFAQAKPPSAKVIKVLTSSLNHPSTRVQRAAVDTIGRLGVSSPEVLSALRAIQKSADKELVVRTSSTLWTLNPDEREILPPVFKALEDELQNYRQPKADWGPLGLGPSATLFVAAEGLFMKMPLSEGEKTKALGLLESCCEKSGRIYPRLLLLRCMMQLGFPPEKGIEVCRAGLKSDERFFRLVAAEKLAEIADKHPNEEINFEELLQDNYVGVRVYAAKAEWLKKRKAAEVLPVLVDALDRVKYQEQSYPDIQSTALEVLGMIGTQAGMAARAVEKLTADPDPTVAKMAREALERIQP